MKKALKWTLISLAALLAILIAAVSVALSPKALTRIVNKVAAGYVDGTAHIGRASVDVLKSFPDIRLEIDTILVTYPHDAFARYDSVGIRSALLDGGRGEAADTLACMDRLRASVNYMAFLRKKEIDAHDIELTGIRAFVHRYDSVTANYSIIRLPASDGTESSAPLPPVVARDVRVKDIRAAVFTSPEDTLFLGTWLNDFDLNGDVSLVDGRLSALAGVLIDGIAHFHNPSVGRIEAPVTIDCRAGIDIDGATAIDIESLSAKVDCLPLEGRGKLIFAGDSTYVGARAAIEDCPVGDLIERYGVRFVSLLRDVRTDAELTLRAEADGWFGSITGLWPLMKAEVTVPDSHVSYVGLVDDGDFDLTLKAFNTTDGMVHADLEDICLTIEGLDLNASGSADDLLGGDPSFNVKAFACTEFADLVRYLPPSAGVRASGDVDFEVEGQFKLSQLNPQDINKTRINGHIFSEGIDFSIPGDTLLAYASRPDIRIRTNTSDINLTAYIDSVRFIAGADTYIMGKELDLAAGNNGAAVDRAGHIRPLTADLSMGSFNMLSSDNTTIGVRDSHNKLKLTNITDGGTVLPEVSVTSGNRVASIRAGGHHISLAGAELDASVRKRTQRSQRLRARTDRPERPFGPDSTGQWRLPVADSLRPERTIPDYLKELDFRKKDIHIDLGEGLNNLYRKWSPTASVSVGQGTVVTPVLPLRNSFSGLKAEADEDQISLRSIDVVSGSSDVSLNGRVSGLRPILSGRRNDARISAVVNVGSRFLDVNELLAALDAGPQDASEGTVEADGAADLDYSLIVIPANIDANLTVDVDSIRYAKLGFNDFTSRIRMRERCVQITRTSASSPMGSAEVDGFYSTTSKQDINAGFNVKLSDVTADRIIELVPVVDSLVPMLKSFKGLLNAEMAATTQLDTNMNILIPSINGAVKINGSGLELSDTGDLRRIAQILMFKDSRVGHIDDLSVNGLISDNRLEVFPFLLGVDRYTLGLSGVQGFDQAFKYHISVIKSPLPFKFGININGHGGKWDFKLGRPKYKSTSIPLITPQVDTMQINLIASIKDIFKKGADAAVREYRMDRRRLDSRKEEFGLYEREEEEDLTIEEQEQLDSYMLDVECEAESEAIEREIEEMLNEESMSSMIEELLKSL